MLLHLAFFKPQPQAADDFAGALIFAYDVIKNFWQLSQVDGAVCEDPLRSLRIAENGAERQVKLVRNRARKFPSIVTRERWAISLR
jgi:hypothetical protein